MKNLQLFIIILLITYSTFAQKNNYLGLEYNQRAGIILAHRGLMSHIPEQNPLGGELKIYYQTNGKSEYHSLYKFPRYGISLIATTVGNNKLLGNLFGATVFGEFPFLRKNSHELSGIIGIGMCYMTKIYDPETNPKNNAISTHINALVNLGIKYRYSFENGLYLSLGFQGTHASNGASRVPNLGINLIQPSVGIGIDFYKVEFDTEEHLINLDKRWKFTLIGIVSAKEIYPIGGKLSPVGGLSFVATKRFTNKSGLELYADGFYKTSILNDIYNTEATPGNIFQLGLFTAYNLYINKLRIVTGLGAYVYDKFKPDGLFYARLGFKYQITPHLMTMIGIKSHWAKADYFEYGIGYTF